MTISAFPVHPEVRIGMDGDMCPNCVTPWKCNGPHELAPRPSTADLDMRDQHGLRWPHDDMGTPT